MKKVFYGSVVILLLALCVTSAVGLGLLAELYNRVSSIDERVEMLEDNEPSATPTPDVTVDPTLTPTGQITATPTQNPGTMSVKLYVLTQSDINDDCAAGSYVTRQIPLTSTPLKDAINALLSLKLTAAETSQGYITNLKPEAQPGFAAFRLVSANVTNGTATLHFDDPQSFTVGGSCRVNGMRTQIEETAKQFNSVNTVKIEPDTLFQP
ncbi:MAG: hypothetical protein TR69_WS6001001141 [candidate division WS6 bacterium OLB20]|uniref:GerMN domain-containing protein n=1 Tax=candidate division WS6 bacterium OLB20 TaxID=1617426 RepID=A0A136LX13_9BACT|nr:MAG: hypothetical protein TR69_WS6001001141 [candidate division WS6 bacterium OLB20]